LTAQHVAVEVAQRDQRGQQVRCRVRVLVERAEAETAQPQTPIRNGWANRAPPTRVVAQARVISRTAAMVAAASSSSRYRGNKVAHYAELDATNTVIRVLVVANDVITAPDGTEDEALGKVFLTDLLGGTWVQTSYNGNRRKRYAGPGYAYDAVRDEFVPPGWSLVDGVWTAPPMEPLP